MSGKVDILGVRFDDVSRKELCRTFRAMLEGEKHRGYVVTPNPEIVERTLADSEYKDIINGASVCLPDGIGIIYASYIVGTPISNRIPGIEAGEIVMRLLSKRKKESIFFLGAEQGVAKAAAYKLSEKYKGLTVAGYHNGFFLSDENSKVVNCINESGAQVLFVCMGCPLQERWISENISKMPNVKIALALGGSLDVYSGKVKRAPEMFRKAGLEWLWRCFALSGHYKRLFSISMFAGHIAICKFHKK